jgi:thiol-disulfide isomerase/thioredoxin
VQSLGSAQAAGVLLLAFAAGAWTTEPSNPETRIVEYLKTRARPGEAVVVSKLYNEVFVAPEERAALNRLFNDFFKIPLFAAQYQKALGKPPSLRDIAEQLHFAVPGEADVLLRVMESDPRMPRFLERDSKTGEIVKVDVEAILADPRFGRALERTIAGWEGKPAPPFSITTWNGGRIASEKLLGKPYVLYFWFSNCPPCMRTAPLLVELDKEYASRGLTIIGANADRVLELPDTDESRAAYARKEGIRFGLAHMSPEMQQAYGMVSVFPTLFFVNSKGMIVKQLVSFQDRAKLEAAARLAIGPS